MNRSVAILVLALLLVLAGGGMWRGWRTKRRADQNLPPLDIDRRTIGAMRFEIPIQYVATCHAQDPSDRVVADGLAMRGHGTLTRGEQGLWLDRVGETSFAIPIDAITNVGPRSWAIDRGSGRNGLIGIDWTLGDVALTTFLRSDLAHDATTLYDSLPTEKTHLDTAMTAIKEQS